MSNFRHVFLNYDFNKWISIHITYWLTILLSTISNNQDSYGHSHKCLWADQIIKPSKFRQTVWFQLGCISVCKTSEPFNPQLCWMTSPLLLWSSVWETLNRFCTIFVASWLSSFEHGHYLACQLKIVNEKAPTSAPAIGHPLWFSFGWTTRELLRFHLGGNLFSKPGSHYLGKLPM